MPAAKSRSKNLNVSLDIIEPPKIRQSSNIFTKMSVTQRLQKIELLEKEDRIHLKKLYGLQKKEPA